MIVTHTTNAQGHRRVYLGGKASIECWVEPRPDGMSWSFHLQEAPAASPLADDDKRAWAQHMLMMLAHELMVPPSELAQVPFDTIAALHVGSPQDYRRVPMPRRTQAEHGYMAAAPNESRPRAEFSREDFTYARYRTG